MIRRGIVKQTKTLVIALCLLLILCACGEAAAENNTISGEAEEAYAAVYGKIKSANGNEITVALLDYSERSVSPGGFPSGESSGMGDMSPAEGEGTDSASSGGPESQPESSRKPPEGFPEGAGNSDGSRPAILRPDEDTEGTGATSMASSGGKPASGERPGGGSSVLTADESTQEVVSEAAAGAPTGGGFASQGSEPVSGRPDSAAGSGDRQMPSGEFDTGAVNPGDGMGAGMDGQTGNTAAYTLTGEEATYLIPVTASITTGEGENARTVRFTQLGYKNVVKISLDEAGTVVAVQVLE